MSGGNHRTSNRRSVLLTASQVFIGVILGIAFSSGYHWLLAKSIKKEKSIISAAFSATSTEIEASLAEIGFKFKDEMLPSGHLLRDSLTDHHRVRIHSTKDGNVDLVTLFVDVENDNARRGFATASTIADIMKRICDKDTSSKVLDWCVVAFEMKQEESRMLKEFPSQVDVHSVVSIQLNGLTVECKGSYQRKVIILEFSPVGFVDDQLKLD